MVVEVFGNPVADGYASRFPRHGWAEDVDGRVGLFFPVLTILEHARGIRDRAGLGDAPSRDEVASARSFLVHVRNLAGVLCELESLVRHEPRGSGIDRGVIFERAPILMDLAFTYLRRLADRFAHAHAAAPVFFRHRASSSHRFAALVKLAEAEGGLGGPAPLADENELRRLLGEHTLWFRCLGGVDSGFRDVLEHRPVEIQLGVASTAVSDKRELVAVLSHGPDDELVTALREICAGLCAFLTRVCRLVHYTDAYRYGDDLNVIGAPEVIPAFWPEI
jgi:hypothetical protein